MKTRLYCQRLIAPLLLIGLFVLQSSNAVMATGTASLSLSPASGSYAKDSTLSVTIYENSTDAVNAVQADLTYDPAKIQFVSIDANSSAFDLSGGGSGGSGSVKIGRAKSNSSLTGNQIVASVNFKVLVGSGSTIISFASSSQIALNGPPGLWNGDANASTYTLTGDSTGGGGGTSSPPTTTTTTTTNNKTTTTTTTQPKTTTPTTTAPTPATTPAPVTTATAPAGYYVAIKVLDSNKKAVQGATVTIDKKTVTTDKMGIASFDSVPPGKHTVTASVKGKSITQTIDVVPGSAIPVQQFSASLDVNDNKPVKVLIWVGAGIVILIIVIGGGTGLLRKIKSRSEYMSHFPAINNQATTAQPPAPPVVPTPVTANPLPKPNSTPNTQLNDPNSNNNHKLLS